MYLILYTINLKDSDWQACENSLHPGKTAILYVIYPAICRQQGPVVQNLTKLLSNVNFLS